MKKIYLPFLLLFTFIFFAKAEIITGCDANTWAAGAEKVWVNEVDKSIKYIKLKTPLTFTNEAEVNLWLRQLLNTATADQFILQKKEKDELGFLHYRYQQYYDGKLVKNAVFYVHTKDQKIISANGEFIPNIQIATSPTLNAAAAQTIGKAKMQGEYAWKNEDFPTPELIVFTKNQKAHLVFQTDIYTTKPLARKYFFIDATDGKIIETYDRIHHAEAHGIAETRYSGTQTISVDSISPTNFVLRDLSRGDGVFTLDMNTSTFYGDAIDFMDTDNFWNTTANKDNAAYDAHWGMQVMYDYLLEEHGRNSFDNAGASMTSFVHFDQNYRNAFWDGSAFTYGDGDGTQRDPYTSIDVVGHEIMHAVTEYSAGLIYFEESGALNESFSDIFGVVQDFRANPTTANFILGEQFTLQGNPIRDMEHPNLFEDPNTYLGLFWNSTGSDNGGVHTNSGVQNFWFQLLVNGGTGVNDNGDSYTVESIGMDAAADIAYRNLTVYLTPNSQYIDARFFAIEAANDLFEDCSAEVINVTNAWQAVGVGGLFSNAVVASFQTNNVYSCVTPATVIFENNSVNANNSFWDFGDGTTSTVNSPNHEYTSPGVYTVTLITEGSALCGNADTLVLNNYVTVSDDGGPTSAACNGVTQFPSSNTGIFQFEYLTITNISQSGLVAHEDFTCTHSTTVVEGVFHPLQIGTGMGETVAVWCDLNNDGLFNNTNEFLTSTTTPSSFHNLSIAIPAGAVYDTPLRLRVKSGFDQSIVNDPCGDPMGGQSEDYAITVTPNSLAPVANFSTPNTTVVANSTLQFTDLTANAPTTWNWEFVGGSPSTSTSQHPSVTYNAVGNYPVKLVVTNANGTDSLTRISYVNVSNLVDMCSPNNVINAPTGIFHDSGGATANYTNNENCTFLIQPLCAQNITLSFTEFATESCCDRLLIYDGADASAPLLVNLGGSSLPTNVTTTGGAMFMEFTSDGSVVLAGWEATWSSQIPASDPVANFTVSDNNPPLNAPVVFTDATSNLPYLWTWDFGDGTVSSEPNPTHTYAAAGTYTVQLIVDNCFATDTISQILTVQAAPNLSVSPDFIDVAVECGLDATAQVVVSNSGSGDGVFEVLNQGTSINETSQTFYSFNNTSSHTFPNIPSNITSLSVEVVINGDFDNTGESASLFIEGTLIAELPDGNVTNGTDIVNTYILDAATLAPYLADGTLVFVVENTSQVDLGVGNAQDFHRVSISAEGSAYLSIDPIGGTVASNGSQVLTLTLSSFGLAAGIYVETFIIETNDPNLPSITIPVTFEVLGAAEISFASPCIDFSSIMEYTEMTLPISIYNGGCDTLDINNIIPTNSAFITNLTQLSLLPFATDTVLITFQPILAGNFDSDIDFVTNVGSASVCVLANAVTRPIIGATPSPINISLNSCQDSTTIALTIDNSGGSDLNYNFLSSGSGTGGSSLDSVRQRLNNSFAEITDLIPNFFEFSDGETGFNINDGGNDMYDGGNALSVNSSFNNLIYSNDVVIPNAELGNGGQYFTRKYPGLFVFAADVQNVNSFDINGNLGADGGGSFNETVLNHNFNGSNYRGFVKRVFNAFDPSVNHLVMVKDANFAMTHQIGTSTDDDFHSIQNMQSASRIYYLLFAGTDGDEYSDAQMLEVMIKFLELVEKGGFVNLPDGNFNLTPSQSESFNLTFVTNNVAGGVYNNSIFVQSNDPLNSLLEIPVIINVSFDLCADFSFVRPIACGGQVDFLSNVVNTPSSILWNFGDGNTSTQVNPTHIYATPGDYTVQLLVSNNTSTDSVNYVVSIDATSAPIAACDVSAGSNFPNREIIGFTLNTINNPTFDNVAYSDFTCDLSTSLTIGLDYEVEIRNETNFDHDSKLWIDLNNDGTFSNDELLLFINDLSGIHTGTITIPSNGIPNIPLRCRVGSDDDFNTLEPCVPANLGEFEDYTVVLIPNTFPPDTDFDFEILDDCQGVVQFSDLSDNIPTGWIWDFGDGTTSGLQNPIHTFNTAGVYTVSLTTTNDFGSNSSTVNVTINSLNPVIEILTDLVIDTPVSFSANAPGAISWNWDFGNGNTATGQNVTHTFTTTGQYTVNLTVVNGLGCQNATVAIVNIVMTGIEEIANDIKIYPNPSTGLFVIENKSGSTYESLEVMNAMSQLIHQLKVPAGSLEQYNLNLQHLPDGVYWLKLQFGEEEQLVKKLTILKE